MGDLIAGGEPVQVIELSSSLDRVHTDIRQFQAQLGKRLLQWGRLSVVVGAILALIPRHSRHAAGAWRGFGFQAVAWGAIDAAIGKLSLRSARAKASAPESHTPEAQQAARRALRRVLWINTGLDVGYVAGGVALARAKGRQSSFRRGAGWSIVVQGGFLLLFDLVHALLLG